MQNRDIKKSERKMYEKHMAKWMQGNAEMHMVQGDESISSGIHVANETGIGRDKSSTI